MKFKNSLDKVGAIGLFITILLSPCCFPLFAFVSSILGFGGFELFGGWVGWVFQALIIITIVGLFFSYKKHQSIVACFIGVLGCMFIFYGFYFDNNNWRNFIYVGMLAVFCASIINYFKTTSFQKKVQQNIQLQTIITCPNCIHQKTETMPTNACMYFYECENCKTILKPLAGDCCVFCSYGTVKCPPVQEGKVCC